MLFFFFRQMDAFSSFLQIIHLRCTLSEAKKQRDEKRIE